MIRIENKEKLTEDQLNSLDKTMKGSVIFLILLLCVYMIVSISIVIAKVFYNAYSLSEGILYLTTTCVITVGILWLAYVFTSRRIMKIFNESKVNSG